jgi:hypothetical protein
MPFLESRAYEEKWNEAHQNRSSIRTNVPSNELDIAILEAIIDFLFYFAPVFEGMGEFPNPNTKQEKQLIKEVYGELDKFRRHLVEKILPAIRGWNKTRWESIWASLDIVSRSDKFVGAWAGARTLMGVLSKREATADDNQVLYYMLLDLSFLANEIKLLISELEYTRDGWVYE